MANHSAGGGVTPQWQSALQEGGGAVMQRSARGGVEGTAGGVGYYLNVEKDKWCHRQPYLV